MIHVINKHTATAAERKRAIYIGRGSPLGNPYKVKPHGPHERGSTLPLYEEHLRERIAEKDLDVCDALNAIWTRAHEARRSGEVVLLMCFCKPKPRHGDVIKKIVEEQLPSSPDGTCSNGATDGKAGKAEQPAGGYSLMGGSSRRGRGTPEGAEKDQAMRRVSAGAIVELGDPARPSSSRTTIKALGPPSFEIPGEIIMLARNGSLRGRPLGTKTLRRIRRAHEAGARFVVGDMPGVDEPMIRFLDRLGARFCIYHAGGRPRIDLSGLTRAENPLSFA